ncbi:hypothetical protein FSP39_019920 [Pinctada imbricata]|uniref:Shugoshin C-terminal domain-containing protein n=1 Tax=Pinctada imbricata TaxID=66713 RepID=A0AA89C888_PINIB|nr:hypothetical protein FSP39_019920 [Pinctada imbricata]
MPCLKVRYILMIHTLLLYGNKTGIALPMCIGEEGVMAAGPTMKATELLRCSDSEFDQSIRQLGMKGLLDTISVLQKEMSREQENFNSLSSELSSLKRNSQQYKQIQREMTASQSKLTSLMNRSMKCFQQQGNQHINKGETTPATTDKDSSSSGVQRRHSARVDGKETDSVKSPIITSQAKSTPNITSEISVKPVLSKPVNNSQEMDKSDDKKVKMTSSINIKPQMSSSQPSVVSASKNTSSSNDHSASKSSILTVNMNSAAKNSTPQSITPSQKAAENNKDKTQNKDSSISHSSMQNGEEKRHSSSIQVIPAVSETTKQTNAADRKNEKETTTTKTSVQKTETPTVVYQGNRPYLVDQNLAQNRETMLDQIRNFQKKTDSQPKVVLQQDKEQKKVYDSSPSVKDNKDGISEVKSENVDSGAEDGSSEPSPDSEKFVSKFTFPQKPKRDPVKLEEKRKARNSDLPVQEEIILQNECEELQTEKAGKKLGFVRDRVGDVNLYSFLIPQNSTLLPFFNDTALQSLTTHLQ